jgi:hypothetical protein
MINFRLFRSIVFSVIVSFLVVDASCLPSVDKEQIDIRQLEKFAANIQASIENNNPAYFNNSFDVNAFLFKILSENASDNDTAFNKGFQEGFQQNFDLGEMIIEGIKQSGTYTFLRAYKRDNNYYLLFRLFANNGVNYHEFEVREDKDKFRIVDAYLFMSGEKMSETIARVYNSFRLLSSALVIDSLSYLQALTDLGKIKELASKGKFSKAYRKWQTLPASYMSDKLFLITGIQIASYLDDKTYSTNYKQFVSNFPDNSSKYLIPLDGFLRHKNYPMALACIDSLDKKLNCDPMLNYLRGNMLYEMGNHTEAAKKMSVLIDSIPSFESGYYSLLGLYVKDKNYMEATRVLDKIVFTFNYYKDDFGPILKEYPDFINSKEYQAWLNQ